MALLVVSMRWMVSLLLVFMLVPAPASTATTASTATCHVDLPGTGLFGLDLSAQGGPTIGGCRIDVPSGSFLTAAPANGCDVTPDGVRSSENFDFVFFQCETGVYDVVNAVTFA